MIRSLQFVGLVGVLVLGSWGWGIALRKVLEQRGRVQVGSDIGPAMEIVLGVVLFVTVGGLLVAVDLAYFDVLITWHIAGAVVAVRSLMQRRDVRPFGWLRSIALGAVGCILLVMSLGTAIGNPSYNNLDDDPAYIYFAQRLLKTGGLLDPFNLRRITSYGADDLYRAMFLQVSGIGALRGFEFTFAACVLLMLTVATTRRRWLVPGTLILGVGIALGLGIGPVANLSPDYSVAVLSLGVFRLLRSVRAAETQWGLYVLIGASVGAIAALRFTYVFSVGPAVIVVIVALLGRRSIKSLLVVAGATVVACSGWALALYRSSGTPLYPALSGNADAQFPSGLDPTVRGVRAHLRLFFSTFDHYDIILIIGAVLVAVIGLTAVTRVTSSKALVLLAAAFGCLVQAMVFTYSLSGLSGLVRYEAPSTLALGLLAISDLWPLVPESAERRAESTPRQTKRREIAGWLRMSGASAWRLAIATTMAFLVFAVTPVTFAKSAATDVRRGAEVVAGRQGFTDRYAKYRREYNEVSALIPKGALVFAAVDLPALLDPTRYRFATLDVPGAVSPGPHLPFFKGAQAKVDYLRRLGYQYIVVTDASQPGLYNLAFYRSYTLFSVSYHNRAWAPYMIDWLDSIVTLENSGRYAPRHVGNLVLIRIDRGAAR